MSPSPDRRAGKVRTMMRGAPAYWIVVLAGLLAACSSDEESSTPAATGGTAGSAGATGGAAGTAGQAGNAAGGTAGSSNGGSSNGGSSNGGSSNGGSSNGGAAGQAGAAGAGGALGTSAKIRFLHHSTGGVIWGGGVADWMTQYNGAHSTQYELTETNFPSGDPYPWDNYPYDYWNIWINHAGAQPYMEEPTLEILTTQYDVIVFKHCFPVAGVGPDTGNADVSSNEKTAENYKLQYAALKDKLHQFPRDQVHRVDGCCAARGGHQCPTTPPEPRASSNG